MAVSRQPSRSFGALARISVRLFLLVVLVVFLIEIVLPALLALAGAPYR